MKQLTDILIKFIEKQICKNHINIIRIEGIDNPIIYQNVCDFFLNYHAGKFVAKLTSEKYYQFEVMNIASWRSALLYLHQGLNPLYIPTVPDGYSCDSFVDFDGAITKWRNESANFIGNTETTLVLLLGTELAPDKGGLEDFCIVSPKELISELKKDYSQWFNSILQTNDLDSVENRAAIDTIYKAIFFNVNLDLFKLSNFIDEIEGQSFGTIQDLIDYICATLKDTWKLPNIIDSKYVPKATQLKNEKLKNAKIISAAYDFINRSDDIPTHTAEVKMEHQFSEYALKENININAPFPIEMPVFSSFCEFQTCVLNFKRGKDINTNRDRLLNIDFAIIVKILDFKVDESKEKDLIITLEGEPLEVFCSAFLAANVAYHEKFGVDSPKQYAVTIKKLIFSNCIDDEDNDEDSVGKVFSDICCFMGGMIEFLNSANIKLDDETISFKYEGRCADPFYFENYDTLKAENLIKISTKWGDPCKFEFTIKAIGDNGSNNISCKWSFSPYAAWNNSFSMLNLIIHDSSTTYDLPTMTICTNISDFLSCESEEEFYVQLNQMNVKNLFDRHIERVRHFFRHTVVEDSFNITCINFKDWAAKTTEYGIFNALTDLDNLVESYKKMMTHIFNNMSYFTSMQRENLFLFFNSFIITSNENIFDNGDVKEVLLPIYNPVMLEKLAAKLQFILAGFKEMMDDQNQHPEVKFSYKDKMRELVQLSTITQGADTILSKQMNFLTNRNTWGYYGVYYDKTEEERLIAANSISSVITDDEESSVMLHDMPEASIIVRNVLDYLHTFPARTDGLNIAFIAPCEMQHIVAAIHNIVKFLEDAGSKSTINVKIICLDSKKNSASYLRRWLDGCFSDERIVKVNTFLRYMNSDRRNNIEELGGVLDNHDLCFIYNLLKPNEVKFIQISDATEVIDRDQSKFPMTFTPEAISSTHGKIRKINISQFQFLCSKYQTQVTHLVGYPNDVDGVYRAVQIVELHEFEERIIDKAHEKCKWVVCIDPSVDRYMLESNNSKIIGFTTGEGCYGELNVTVSARKDILNDIKDMLRVRITEKFRDWEDTDRIKKAADYCIELTQTMDGSKILKALNPYDYEIHSFLAYILTLQMLHITRNDNNYIVRSLISLDSYKHWFESSTGNSRPDFMLLEIPNIPDNLDINKPLKIKVKIIECKMGFENEVHLDKAREQLTKGIKEMCINWDPKNSSVMHRYWRNQLYRAIIFSPLNMSDNDVNFQTIQDKIFKILAGQYEIEWSGDIFAFWLDVNSETVEEYNINYDSSLDDEIMQRGLTLTSMICHTTGQMFIQKMLLPAKERSASFSYNDIIVNNSEETDCNDNLVEASNDKIGDGSSIPKTKDIYISFLQFLSDKDNHTRQESLAWYVDKFNISASDKVIKFGNGHYKYETILDFVITEFRQNKLLENSKLGEFHITDFGKYIFDLIIKQGIPESFILFIQDNMPEKRHLFEFNKEKNNQDYHKETIISSKEHQNNNMFEQMRKKKEIQSVRLLLGEDLRTKEKYYWEFGNKELNNRHLLINGNSGCGKTYCIQGLLMESALQGVSSVIFDYTGGFATDKLDPTFKEKLGDKIEQRFVRKDKIPVNPFARHQIVFGVDYEYPEEDTDIARRIANTFKSVYKFGEQQQSCIYNAVINGLKKHKNKMTFLHMAEELSEISLPNAKTVLSKIQPFIDLNPFAIVEDFNWETIRSSDGIIYVFQMIGYDRETQVLLTELLLWDIWSFCSNNGSESCPLILVMDEAQNLSHGEESPSAKILTEGRKFGISGWYATQFMKPQLSDDEIQRLQQSGQKLYFCPPDDGVTTIAKNIDITPQGSKDWSERLKKLKKGECVTCGNMVRNDRWTKYEPKIIKITSMQERMNNTETNRC